MPTHYCKNLSIDFVTSFLILRNVKNDSYNLILVIYDYLTKMMYYKLVKTIVYIAKFIEDIINIMIK